MRRERKFNRLKDYNYSQNGMYYVTICTKGKRYYFGQLGNNEIILNNLGEITQAMWLDIPIHFDYVKLDEFIIMPNHIHGIIEIYSLNVEDAVGNRHACSLRRRPYQLLPIIIGSFKSAVTRIINQLDSSGNFQWQCSYYDHVIRNKKSLEKIREYIICNPMNWWKDNDNIESIDGNLLAKRTP